MHTERIYLNFCNQSEVTKTDTDLGFNGKLCKGKSSLCHFKHSIFRDDDKN